MQYNTRIYSIQSVLISNTVTYSITVVVVEDALSLFLCPLCITPPPLRLRTGRQYTRRVNDAIIGLLDDASVTGVIPKGAASAALKVVEPDWSPRIDSYMKTHSGLSERVHTAAAKYPDRVHYSRNGYAAMAAVLRKHLDRDCVDDTDLEAAFVTSCQLESFFAVIDDTNRASNFICITENRGQAMAIKSHTFMTADERLRQEMKRRKKSKLPPLTQEEVLHTHNLLPGAFRLPCAAHC